MCCCRGENSSSKIDSLPLTRFVVGDSAHTCTEHLLTPLKGIERNDHPKDHFKCHLSQHRIRIECSFGRLVGKWCILKRPLETSLDSAIRITHCVARLRNWCHTDNSGMVLLANNQEAVWKLCQQSSIKWKEDAAAGMQCWKRQQLKSNATKLLTWIIHLCNAALWQAAKHVMESLVIFIALHWLLCFHDQFCKIFAISHHFSVFLPSVVSEEAITLDLFAFLVNSNKSHFLHCIHDRMLLLV